MGKEFNMTKVFENANRLIDAYHTELQVLCRETGLPTLAVDILLFIANNPKMATAKDICVVRSLKSGIVSVYVERLVEDGFIERSSVEGDRRKIMLKTTCKADEIIKKGKVIQDNFAEKLLVGVKKEDLQVWKRIVEVIDDNIERIRKEK